MLHSLPSSWHFQRTEQVNLLRSQMLGQRKKYLWVYRNICFFKSPNTSIGVVLKNPLVAGLIFLLVITFSLPPVIYD